MFTWEIMSSLFKNPNHVLFKDPVVIMKEITSLLLRVQLTVVWLKLTMPNQTVKNGPKGWKDQIAPNEFFSRKAMKLSCSYWPLSFCKI